MKSLKEYFKARLNAQMNEDMAFDTAGMKASEANVRAAETPYFKLRGDRAADPNNPVRQRYEKALADHVAMGSSDTVFTHDPTTGKFVAITTLPAGLSNDLAADAMRYGSPTVTGDRAQLAADVATKLGGLHGVAGWEDPEISPMDRSYTVPPNRDIRGKPVTLPGRHARNMGRA